MPGDRRSPASLPYGFVAGGEEVELRSVRVNALCRSVGVYEFAARM